MTICGYLIDETNVHKLKELGVKDSKMLSAVVREKLVPKLKKIADDYIVLSISAKQIDKLRSKTNLNKMEIDRIQHMINMFTPDKVIIDSPEVNTIAFSRKIMAKVKDKKICVTSENFADKRHPEVGAASIMAKVTRDGEIKKLHKTHGYFGSGYASDETTIAFLKDWIKRNKEFPAFVRKSWFTSQWILEERQQLTMRKFTGK